MTRLRTTAATLCLLGCWDTTGVVIDGAKEGPSTLAAAETGTETETETDTASEIDTGSDTVQFDTLYMLGADISFVQEQEDLGARFVEDGEERDFIALMKDHGFNALRLRIFYDPGQPDGYQFAFGERAEPYCDLAHTLGMAKRIKDAGMRLFLNFHYSDTWADPANQNKPAAWEDLPFEALREALYEYTRDTLVAFHVQRSLPDLVQLGNEITPGMLFPDGRSYSPDNWDQLAELLIAGATAVKEVDPRIRTVVHLDLGDSYDETVWWVNEALARGVELDVLAQSTYSEWQGEPSEWRATFEALAETYPELHFLIAEYADNHREANDILRSTPRGLGTFVWEPTADGRWGEGLFDMPDGAGEATPRETLYLFDEMADDYGLR